MLGAPACHAVGKFGQVVAAAQMDILHFHETGAGVRAVFQEQIHPAVLAIAHLAPQAGVALKLRDHPANNGFLRQGVGPAGVDAHQGVVGLQQFQRMFELAFGIVA